jgi:hypothetical protein
VSRSDSGNWPATQWLDRHAKNFSSREGPRRRGISGVPPGRNHLSGRDPATSWLANFIRSSGANDHTNQSQRDCVLQPRVAQNALPWVNRPKKFSTPTGLWRSARQRAATSLGLMASSDRRPKVARSSQPWALRRNPVGIPAMSWRRARPIQTPLSLRFDTSREIS